jgi:hypothetical protein
MSFIKSSVRWVIQEINQTYRKFNFAAPTPPNNLTMRSARFHVVVPSLPGFGFSSPAPPGWTLNKTADLFDGLLTEVLGYKSYAAVGGDWVIYFALVSLVIYLSTCFYDATNTREVWWPGVCTTTTRSTSKLCQSIYLISFWRNSDGWVFLEQPVYWPYPSDGTVAWQDQQWP